MQPSNGVACHYDLDTAIKKTYEELIERHLFLSHFHSGIPFYKINPQSILPFSISNTLNKINREKVELSFYILLDSVELCSILVVSSGLNRDIPWGFVFGIGVASTIQVALEKALIENLRKLS
jgi:ribosomal protein S12 methylthiotransferase accessory factor YcaO